MVDVPFWPALLFWPAIAAGLVAACLGILRHRPSWLLGAVVLLMPASLFLTATPRLRFVGFLPVLFLLVARHAVQRHASLVAAGFVIATVLFLSWVASIVGVPILIHLLVVGAACGVVAARRVGWWLPVYIVVGLVGAFAAALLSFGDAPFLMRHSYLNPWTLSVVGAALLVSAARAVESTVHSGGRSLSQ
ncbi:MAG: hypothetical protein QF681_09895 [Vicinamibacterales bacterium]|jgi:uncharacterized membrane protein YeaQ/YmgE (transglycosylase-associated protein family)|nr:hypothetical protein [Vicinamibacterales bacterium]